MKRFEYFCTKRLFAVYCCVLHIFIAYCYYVQSAGILFRIRLPAASQKFPLYTLSHSWNIIGQQLHFGPIVYEVPQLTDPHCGRFHYGQLLGIKVVIILFLVSQYFPLYDGSHSFPETGQHSQAGV